MWPFRRASVHLRNRRLTFGGSQIFFLKPERARCLNIYNPEFVESRELPFDGVLASTRSYNTSCRTKMCMDVYTFSSQAGAESKGDENDDVGEGLSELETSGAVQQATSGLENDDELISESDAEEEESVIDDTQDMLEELGTQIDGDEEKYSPQNKTISEMNKAILHTPTASVCKVLDKWVEEGNEVTRKDVTVTYLNLRKRKLFVKALKLSEWLESRKHLDFLEGDYASRLDLIAKTSDIFKAENYINKIPESFRGEIVYRTLLANCVSTTHVKKSEEVFNKMKSLKFPLSCFTCNNLLLLYKRTDKRKIADVLLLMEKEDVKPSLFTYQILIDVKGLSNDINGMEQIVETMKAEGKELNFRIQSSLAQHYASSGMKEKAESVLKLMEGKNLVENRRVYQTLLPIYASLGQVDEVDRLWKSCESNPRLRECMAAVTAWGKLDRIEDAEAAFEKMLKVVKNPTSKHFDVLLKVYTDHKMLFKGEQLIKRMANSGSVIHPSTLDSVIKLYTAAGAVEKADSILEKAIKQKKGVPMLSSFLCIMQKYADKGDVHNAEKIFLKMRQSGYIARFQQYQLLVQTYVNAKATGYGLADRLKADNIFPNKALAAQLDLVNPFRKSDLDKLFE